MALLDDRMEKDVLVLTISENRLDASVSGIFKEEMDVLIQQEGYSDIVLDISNVTFMDSSGLGAIISALNKMNQKGNFVLCGVGEMVMKIFKLTRMHKIFRMYETWENAVAAISE